MNNILNATRRSKTDKLADIRKNGMLPAVVYGARVENTLISVPSVNFIKLLSTAGETSTIVLEIAPGKPADKPIKVDVLIHEIQKDPVKDFPIHVDFLAIDMNKPIEVSVPIEFIGIAPAEKNGLGVLVKVLHEVEVEALPKDIPQILEVDLTSLNTLDDQIHVKDIKIAKEVKFITNENEVVALISLMKEEKEEEVVVDLSSIEVEKKGKQEDEANKEEGKAEEKSTT
jgi:large subunit ribosomal protein L25